MTKHSLLTLTLLTARGARHRCRWPRPSLLGRRLRPPIAPRSRAATYLVKIMACNDCHTPFKMGAAGARARHDPHALRPSAGHGDAAAAGARPGPVGLGRRGATNTAFAGPWGVSFTANLTPDPETGLGRWTETDVHPGAAHRPSRGPGPPDPAADALAPCTGRPPTRTCGRLRLPAVDAADQEPRAAADRSAGGHPGGGRPLNRRAGGTDDVPPAGHRHPVEETTRCASDSNRSRDRHGDSADGRIASGPGAPEVPGSGDWLTPAAAAAVGRRSGPGHRPPAPPAASETGLYAADGTIDPRNLPFAPQYPLWTDGAAKARWIRLPEARAIDVTDVDAWRFPAGTMLWKEFAFGGRKVETRMLWQPEPDAWVFADLRLERGADRRRPGSRRGGDPRA